MSSYLKKVSGYWSTFAKGNRETADTLHLQAMALCEIMTGDKPGDQISKMCSAQEYEPFRKIVLQHKTALGLSQCSHREIALWVRTICYCSTIKAVQTA